MSIEIVEDSESGHGHGKGHRSGQPGQTRPIGKRHVPFAALFLMAFIVIPLLETISWLVRLWDEGTGNLAAWMWMLCGAGTAVAAIFIGMHRRRATFIVGHVAATAFAWGSASALTTLIGWTKIWGVIHFFGSMMLAISWALYRIDVFRAAATGQSGEDGWGKVIGLARSRPKKVTYTDTHLFVEVEHGPGETKREVASAAARMESAIGAIDGGTVVEAGERADTTKLAFEIADAFANWRNWPGPSHPGLSFVYPFRTGYYATGEDEWFSFAANANYPSPRDDCDFASEMDTFVGAAGTTGSGKSGFLNNACAEGLTRVDCIVVWLDREKFLQNAGWAASMLGMGGNDENGRDFNKALRRLAEYRVGVFGQAALDAVGKDGGVADIGRKWTPELARETGEAAVLVIVDEADTSIQSSDWDWLAKRARSLGIFLLPATPRVSTAEVPAAVRSSIGAWKTFATGDNYSGGFTICQETEDAGANPSKFREPGMHYLDRAPGVDRRKWPWKAREYKSTTKVLRAACQNARSRFNPAVFSPGAIEAMGDHYWRCHPRVVLKLETIEDLKVKYGTIEPPPEPDYVPPEAADNPMDLEQTMPLSLIQNMVIAVAGGAVQSTDEERAEAVRILAANGLDPQGRPLARVATPQTPPPTGREDEDDDDDDREEDEMASRATGTDVDSGEVATIDHVALGTTDAELAAELAKVDPREPIDVRHAGTSIQLDAEDPERPRWSPEETEREFDRVLSVFAASGKMTFTNQQVMEAMLCEFSSVTCSRRLNGLAASERIVPPGLKVERTDRSGVWMIVRSAPSPRPRS